MFPTLDLRAAPTDHARGLIHGQGARAQVAHSVSTYARMFAGCGISWTQACERAQAYADVIAALSPCWMAEIQGIAEGSGQPLEAILALNCRTEILPPTFFSDEPQLAHAALAANRAAGLPDWLADAPWDGALNDGECTAMGVTSGGAAAACAARKARAKNTPGNTRASTDCGGSPRPVSHQKPSSAKASETL